MISIESSPSDPSSSSCSCSCITDQNRVLLPLPQQFLITSSNSDEKKASTSTTSAYDDDNKLALVEEEDSKEEEQVVDLLESCVHESNPTPEFSIRDYVYGLRSKDVTKNWPFSKENLMLCLKHGVRNLLPPFQPLDSLKNPSVIEKSLPDNEIVTSSNGGEPSKQSDQFVSATSQSAQYNPELDSANKIPNCVELGANSLVEVSKQKSQLEVPSASQKTETASQPSQVKKCKLVVKFGPIVDPASMVSETIASKVCPVCKTFTSSSNTTLNAHIDQCLSGESTMKWKANPKVLKNRVKPRKMRSMVDIYKTAPSCTLEELDRRNGANWATNSSFPTQEIEFHGEEQEKEQRVSNDNVVETGHEGDVYIDSEGTKVRILSAPKIGAAGDDHGSRKLLKQKGSKFLAGKNEKKTREEKHHKFLKLSPHSKKFSSRKSRRGFEMQSKQEKNFSVGGDCEEEDTPEQRFQSEEELELDDDQGTIKPWGCSRRSGHTKDLRYNVTRNLPVERDRTSPENRCFSRTLSSSDDNPISSPESSERMDTSPYDSQDDEYVGQPLLRKRVAFRSGSSASNKAVELSGQSNNSGNFVISPNARKLPSLRKNLSVRQNFMPIMRPGLKRKSSALKKTRSHVVSSQADCLHNQLQDSSEHVSQVVGASRKTSLGSSNVMEIRKTRAGIKISGEQSDQPRNTMDSLADARSSGKEILTHDESLTIEPNSRTSVGRNYLSLNPELDSQHSVEGYQVPFSESERPILSPQASLDGREKMFSEDDIGKTMTGQTNCKNAESDYKEMGHGVYFLEVERIPIPGPPGSFLPSPGADMVSEDVQGNSSLTNSRVHSSEDRLDLVDRDSMLDSPISATSTISNPTLTRSNSRSSEKLSVRSVAVEENQVQQAANMVEERTEATLTERGVAPSLRNDHQPCCCSRKEGVAQSFSSLYQESSLLKRRVTEWNNKRSVNSLSSKPEAFTISNYEPERAFVPPESNSNARNVAMTAPAGTAAASPSSSNPVLRLMGKDLMVVKKDQDVAPPQLTPPQSSSFDHPNRQFLTAPASATGNLQNQDYQSLHQVFPQSYAQNHNGPDRELQHIDFRNYVQPHTPQTPSHTLERSFTNSTMLPGGYMTSVNSFGLGGSRPSFMPQAPPDRSNNSYDSPFARASNNNNAMKEIIIIDDSPKNEVDLVHNGAMSTNQAHFPSSEHNPRHMNSFYNNQSQGSFSYGGTQAINDASFPRPVSREILTASPAVWNRVPEGSSFVGGSREMNTTSPAMWNRVSEGSVVGVPPPASTAHLRGSTTTYYPTSYS